MKTMKPCLAFFAVSLFLGGSALADEPAPAAPAPAAAPAAPAPAPAVSASASVTAEVPAGVEETPHDLEAVSSGAPRDRLLEPRILLGVRAGAVTPQVFNKLGTNFLVELEGAYQLPFAHRRLGIFLDVGYSQPTESGSHQDPRVLSNSGKVNYTMTVRDLTYALGLQYRRAGKRFVPYGGLGADLHLTKTLVNQHAGSVDLGQNTQQSTRVGVVLRLGLGMHAGPGDLVGELHVEYAGIDHLISGTDNTGHLAFQIGYLLRL